MARYREFLCTFWDDPNVEKYNPHEKLVFAFLITNKNVTESGIYPMTIDKIGYYTKLKNQEVRKILPVLKNIKYDYDNEVVFVVNFLIHNKRGRPELIMKSIANDVATIRTTLWNDFKEKYPLLFEKILNIVNTIDNVLPYIAHINNEDDNDNEDRDRSNKDKEKKPRKSPEKIWMTYYNQALKNKGWLKRELQLTYQRKRLIKSRLKDYSLADLKLCVDNFIQDTWSDRHKFIDPKYCIGVIRGKDMLEKWLNYKGESRDPLTEV